MQKNLLPALIALLVIPMLSQAAITDFGGPYTAGYNNSKTCAPENNDASIALGAGNNELLFNGLISSINGSNSMTYNADENTVAIKPKQTLYPNISLLSLDLFSGEEADMPMVYSIGEDKTIKMPTDYTIGSYNSALSNGMHDSGCGNISTILPVSGTEATESGASTVTINFIGSGLPITSNVLDYVVILYYDEDGVNVIDPIVNPYTINVDPDQIGTINFNVANGFIVSDIRFVSGQEDSVGIYGDEIYLIYPEGDLVFDVTISRVQPCEVTLEFTGVENAAQAVTVFDQDNRYYLQIKDNQIIFDYKSSATLELEANEGYEIKIKGPEGIAPEYMKTYTISYDKYLDLFSGVSGMTFTIEITDLSTDAVEGINVENGRYNVVSLQGMKVLDTDNAADINSLAKGVYIINGKKVAVK